MSDKMKLIMENWRKLQEAEKHSVSHVVNKANRDGISLKAALKQLLNDPPISDKEADDWLDRHKDKIADAEGAVKENSMQGGNVQMAPATQRKSTDEETLSEDNYEDSGEPWDPRSTVFPFQHPQKGKSAKYNKKSLEKWVADWKPSKKHPQLTKAVRVAPKGGGRIGIGAGVPFKRRYEEGMDEGMKEIAFATILGLMGIGDASAGTVSDPVSGKTYSSQVVKKASQAASGAAAKNPDNKALQVLAKGLQAADENPGDTTMAAIPDLNMDVASDVVDYAKHVLDRTEAKLSKKSGDAPEASGKPDISGMSAPEARKALYDYYGPDDKMATMKINKDLRDAGIGQPSDAERQKMQKDQADMSAKMKKSNMTNESAI